MAELLIPVHSSLTLAIATRITDEALRLRALHRLLPLAVMVLDSGAQVVSYRREDGCGVMRHDIAMEDRKFKHPFFSQSPPAMLLNTH